MLESIATGARCSWLLLTAIALLLSLLLSTQNCKAQLVDSSDYASAPSQEAKAAARLKEGNWRKQGAVSVYFVTSRLNEAEKDNPAYGSIRHLDLGDGSLEYGLCRVSFPSGLADLCKSRDGAQYKQQIITNSSLWESSRTKSFQTFADEEEFYRVVRGWQGTICVFTHGYDKTFEQSVRDLAILCAEYETRCPGQRVLPILFTWPSSGSPTKYAGDESNLEWSEKPFFEFLDKLLKEKPQSAPLDLVAHSMGCRLLFRYCQSATPAIASSAIRNMFLCSADVDFHYAEQHKKELQDCTKEMVYVLVSDKDGPLIMSEYLHGHPRLGRPVDPPKVSPGKVEADGGYLLQLASQALDLVRRNGMNDSTDVDSWLASNPALDKEYGPKARLVDVTEVMNETVGHAMAWPVVAGLMASPPSISPVPASIVHKRPDRDWLQRCGGRPFCLYRFNKLDVHRLNGG